MPKPPSILILTTVRNEGAFLLEWLAHHKALGATGALVFSNDCDDGTVPLLEALAAAGEVIHLPQRGGGKSVQWRALQAAAKHPAYAQADWAMAIDCDEFVNPAPPFDTLGALIDAADGADAIALPWRLFGAAGRLRYEEGPVTELFTRAAPEAVLFPAAARFFKTLYRVRGGPFARPGVHRPKARAGARPAWVDGAGQALPEAFVRAEGRILMPGERIANARVQLNHYALRSAEDFLVKRRRGLPNRASKPLDATYWAERNLNTVADETIARHGPAAARERARLLALPGVAEAQAAAVAAHRAAIAACLADPDEARLFTRLALLRDSVLPERAVALELLEIARRAAEGR